MSGTGACECNRASASPGLALANSFESMPMNEWHSVPSDPSEQPLHQRGPLVFEPLPVEPPPRPFIPIVGVPCLALFLVQVGVNGHSISGFKLIHQRMRSRPVSFGVPPQSGQRRGQRCRRFFAAQRRAEFICGHTTLVTPTFWGSPDHFLPTKVICITFSQFMR